MWARLSIALAAWLCACGGQDAEQARALLSAVRQVELGAPLSERGERIERLQQLPLADEGLRATREACVAAHTRLLEAEVLQAEVKQGLAREPAGPEAVAATKDRLAQLLQQSEDARAQGQAALSSCRERTRALAKRFR